MNELLRFTARGQNGPLILFPQKFDFVFYDQKLEIYKKGKLVRTIGYGDIKEVAVIKNWQNNVFINCMPFGVNIYNISDDICSKIKEITSNKGNNDSYDEFEKNGFIKLKKDRKILIRVYNKNSNDSKLFDFNYETNIINVIPETDIKFAIGNISENDESFTFFINKDFNSLNNVGDSPTRTFYPGLTDKYAFRSYIFNYTEQPVLKVDTDGEYYLEVSLN